LFKPVGINSNRAWNSRCFRGVIPLALHIYDQNICAINQLVPELLGGDLARSEVRREVPPTDESTHK
jgi:hypothetical protein